MDQATEPAPQTLSLPDRVRRDNCSMNRTTEPMASASTPAVTGFRERLVPGPGLFIALLLLVPAVMLTVTPLSSTWALPVAIALYAIVAGSLVLMSPTIKVEHGELQAGAARISVDLLGAGKALGREELRVALGPGIDARSFLLVRGYVHSGVSIELSDPNDPTPRWILTTRKPGALLDAIDAARAN